MSNDKLKHILDDSEKKINETRNPLARLCRLILMDLDIDIEVFDSLLNKYAKAVNKMRGKENASTKTNFTSAITHPKLSWRYFERFLQVLEPIGVRITVDITWKDKSVTSHSVDIDMVSKDIGGE